MKYDWIPGPETSFVRNRKHIAGARGCVVMCVVAFQLVAAMALAAPDTSSTVSAAEPTTVAASHILFRYWGAPGASVLQTSPTALQNARKALARVLEPGADFEALAQQFQKDYPDVGYEHLKPFGRGRMQKPFEDTVFNLKPGQIADYLTSTSYGFHIVRRNPAVRARHILISYKGASRATVARSKEEARKLAESVREMALKPGADFAALVQKYSDAPDKSRGGDVGVFDRGLMIAAFENAAFALKVGEISPMVETRYGFHILQRTE